MLIAACLAFVAAGMIQFLTTWRLCSLVLLGAGGLLAGVGEYVAGRERRRARQRLAPPSL